MKNKQKGFIVPLLIVIIAVLIIGGGVYVYNKNKVKTPAVDNTQPINQNQQTNNQIPLVNTQTKICSTTGISVILPDRPTYICEPDDNSSNHVISLYVGYIDRESMSGMSDSGGLPGIMHITKYENLDIFDNIKSTNINQEYYTLIDDNYPISGTTGLYYKSKPGAFGDGEGEIAIAVPSKFIIVHVDSLDSLAKVYKMNNKLRDLLKTERDLIIKSISF